jgi:CPA2 family monovalent cation:H+ antiporter-2
MAEFEVSPDSELIGRYLYKADFRNNHGVSIVSIHRGSRRINIPGARDQLMPFDRISVVGNDEHLKAFGLLVEQKDVVELCTQQSCGVSMQNLTIDEDSIFVGKTIRESNFNLFNCLIISIERRGDGVVLPTADVVFRTGDLVTLVGQQDKMQSIIQGFCPLKLK